MGVQQPNKGATNKKAGTMAGLFFEELARREDQYFAITGPPQR